jgi:hypothetical protein
VVYERGKRVEQLAEHVEGEGAGRWMEGRIRSGGRRRCHGSVDPEGGRMPAVPRSTNRFRRKSSKAEWRAR